MKMCYGNINERIRSKTWTASSSSLFCVFKNSKNSRMNESQELVIEEEKVKKTLQSLTTNVGYWIVAFDKDEEK